jgi:hypothetical protein
LLKNLEILPPANLVSALAGDLEKNCGCSAKATSADVARPIRLAAPAHRATRSAFIMIVEPFGV